jgi:hypothetical protein
MFCVVLEHGSRVGTTRDAVCVERADSTLRAQLVAESVPELHLADDDRKD